ncbi:MFS transporter [Acrocarpospora catenulata]|uniref:MFS transporter n=1 Tax=Acrocarpospora catenulata TaxID=2836182 RepID=UPI001BDB3717|nr:MFS transporter [Acrocarpospora catenulata]
MAVVPLEPGSPEYAQALRYAWKVCSVTSLGLVLIGISGSTLNVALPSVVRHFQAGPLAANWVLLAFLLVNTATLVFFGRVADLLGRREVYLVGFVLFTAASLLAGLAPNVGLLIALRAVQGLGAAMILANGTVIITDAFPADRLSLGMGVYLGTFSVAQLAGPTLGGLIAHTLGWQWIFWINVPAGLIALSWGAATLRATTSRDRQPMDLAGNFVIFVALSVALVALTEAGASGLGSPIVPVGGAVVLVLLPVLVLVERRAASPVLNGALFGARMLVFANAASFCNALARSSLILLAGLYFQAARGVDALTAGLGVLPMPVGMALAAPIAGALGRRFGAYVISVAGSLLGCAGLLVLTAGTGAPYPVIAAGLFLAGCGSGTFLTGNTTQVMEALPPGGLGVVNGFRLMIMNVGIVLSVGSTLSLLTSSVSAELRGRVYQGLLPPGAIGQLMGGFRLTYAVLLGVCLLGALFAVLARSSPPAPAASPPAPPPRS